jgi:hypothetical protein
MFTKRLLILAFMVPLLATLTLAPSVAEAGGSQSAPWNNRATQNNGDAIKNTVGSNGNNAGHRFRVKLHYSQ